MSPAHVTSSIRAAVAPLEQRILWRILPHSTADVGLSAGTAVLSAGNVSGTKELFSVCTRRGCDCQTDSS